MTDRCDFPACIHCGRAQAGELILAFAATARHVSRSRTTATERDAFAQQMARLDRRLLHAWLSERLAESTEGLAHVLGLRLETEEREKTPAVQVREGAREIAPGVYEFTAE